MAIDVIEVQVAGPQGPPGEIGPVGPPSTSKHIVAPAIPGTYIGMPGTTTAEVSGYASYAQAVPGVTTSGIQFNVTTGEVGSSVSFAVYDSDERGGPTNRLALVENIGCETTGLKRVLLSITPSSNILWVRATAVSPDGLLRVSGYGQLFAAYTMTSQNNRRMEPINILPSGFPEVVESYNIVFHAWNRHPRFEVCY